LTSKTTIIETVVLTYLWRDKILSEHLPDMDGFGFL